LGVATVTCNADSYPSSLAALSAWSMYWTAPYLTWNNASGMANYGTHGCIPGYMRWLTNTCTACADPGAFWCTSALAGTVSAGGWADNFDSNGYFNFFDL